MSQIFIISLFLLIVQTRSYDLLLGYPDTNSNIIYSKVHQENPAIWYRSETFTVNCSKSEVINAIKVLDLRDDLMGEVYLKSGGIGQKFVTLELDSPSIFRGYNFYVEIYAIQNNEFMFKHGK
ncbi:uncharacterized protein LOC123664684 [Melitaea cinxia]|uniref:uncharacterized protein LOC123664684 n=1 Tax=Melitaea cinxia TaxID=113334 RepID=UPI001E271BF7|nr:uncharacterized protein LOC123664684 [Melitaea cinxia]